MLLNMGEKSFRKAWEEAQNSDFHGSFGDRSVVKAKCEVCEYQEFRKDAETMAYASLYGAQLLTPQTPPQLLLKLMK